MALVLIFLTPSLWLFCGKLFKINDITFKNAFFAYVLFLIAMIASVMILAVACLLLDIDEAFIQILNSVIILILAIWIIKKTFKTTILRSIGVYLTSVIFAISLALLIRTFGVQAFKIPSSGAMKNSILIGDHILVNKFVYGIKLPIADTVLIPISKPKYGDIIVFKYPKEPEKDFIKRVIGVGGDVIEIKDKQVYVNNTRLNENYVIHTDSRIFPEDQNPRDNLKSITVPENSLFVMGDNRDHSYDSRFWGVVDLKAVKGKAFVIYWSWDNKINTVRWNRIGEAV